MRVRNGLYGGLRERTRRALLGVMLSKELIERAVMRDESERQRRARQQLHESKSLAQEFTSALSRAREGEAPGDISMLELGAGEAGVLAHLRLAVISTAEAAKSATHSVCTASRWTVLKFSTVALGLVSLLSVFALGIRVALQNEREHHAACVPCSCPVTPVDGLTHSR